MDDDAAGGLVATRPVKEWVLGHVEPLLPLALGKDSPAAMSYNILPNAPEGLDGRPPTHPPTNERSRRAGGLTDVLACVAGWLAV